MSVPDLSADTPVTKVFDPVKVYFFVSIGENLDLFSCFEHEILEALPIAELFVYIDKPLELW